MIEGLKPHGEYKASGLDWLGMIPKHWHMRLGRAAFEKQKILNRGLEEKTVLSLSYGRIKVKPIDKQHGLVPESYETYQIVNKGNIIIRGTDLQNDHTSLRIGLAHNRGIISSAYLCLETRDTVSPEYGYQILNVFDITKAIYRYGSGLRQNLDHSEIKRLLIFIPPTDEQATIVRFLDYANLKIDGFIRAKRKLIALLGEQKQTIVNRAVTCGLNPNVPLKPSGVPWLGDIPEHWGVVRNMALFAQRVEPGIPNLPILQVSLNSGVTSEELDQFGRPKKLIADVTKYKLVRHLDLAYNTMRMWQGAVGVVPLDGLVSPAYVVLKPRNGVCSEFYNYLFHTEIYKQQVNRYSTGIVSDRNRLYWDSFKQMPNIKPPKEEQEQIVAFIEHETQPLNNLIARTEREISLMQEFRTRLIADIVTGKLDVREAVAKLQDQPITVEHVEDVNELDDEILEEIESEATHE
jgi:type I restriction enzyme, S subunit